MPAESIPDFFPRNAAVLIMILAVIAIAVIVYAVNYVNQQDEIEAGKTLPFVSEGLLRAPYAKEAIVMVFLAFIFVLRTRCDLLAEFITWIWLFSFFNQENGIEHRAYVTVAGGLTYLLIMGEKQSLGPYRKAIKVCLTLAAVALIWTLFRFGEDVRNDWFVTEYFFLFIIAVAMILRTLYSPRCTNGSAISK
mmetsp:Transcript_4170/g.6512  ORF Transcript_4170/g.6512 Transcript_4170/m.6512 type:complete len:193 (+) Transcript_4170:1696-2274(+)|eukprot:CAMPEP_0175106600 /NCGR_PEP_ID=MMETSP0086_2-20121207/11311_1 /TAXON_ID=136419 /ORGANISM="Unknown Unknown, Strain D1" /LENGTH=192 /DNA_ID=CAMNT_0016382997 /DNA_START=357 /DNA_END=935 /DNA_ORIENTATION=-